MTLIQSTAFRHALRLQLKHISHPAVAFVSKVSVGRRRRRDRRRHHELNRARRRACVALARHRRGPLAEDIEGSIVGAAEGRALQPRQERAQGFSSRPESYRAACCVPGRSGSRSGSGWVERVERQSCCVGGAAAHHSLKYWRNMSAEPLPVTKTIRRREGWRLTSPSMSAFLALRMSESSDDCLPDFLLLRSDDARMSYRA